MVCQGQGSFFMGKGYVDPLEAHFGKRFEYLGKIIVLKLHRDIESVDAVTFQPEILQQRGF